MQVTTFYSYKGGLGRSLLLSWAARALALEGQSVVAVDLDLEAPGLAFKLRLDEKDDWGPGVVGLLRRFLGGEPPPDSLEDWLIPVPGSENLRLLPAGPAPSAKYWEALASISWDDLFFGPNPQGARFFTWLRESIEEASRADHLLVDARTGVTELGGAALSLMADQVLALLGTAREGVLGTREVLRSVMSGPRPAGRPAPRIGLVLARMPATLAASDLQSLRKVLRDQICEETEPLSATVTTGLPLVVRSEPSLQHDEEWALTQTDLRVHEDYAAVLDWILGGDSPEEAQGITYHPDQGVAELKATIEMQRAAASRDPETYLPELATTLENLSASLESHGGYEQAVLATTEAVEIRRVFADSGAESRIEQLARSLANLGSRLDALGRWEEARAALEESVEIRRDIATQGAPNSESGLARSLNNLAAAQSSLGELDEALASIQEAADIQRRLAALDSNRLSELATCLGNLGAMQGKLGLYEAARDSTQEAIATFQSLDRSEVVLVRTAHALNNLGLWQGRLGKREDALAAIQRATTIYRELVESNPEEYCENLASSLTNLGSRLADLKQFKLALDSSHEAVEILQHLAEQRPDRFGANLALALVNLAGQQSALSHHDVALDSLLQAERILNELANRRPRAHLPDHARLLSNRSAVLIGKEDWQAAVEAGHEAVAIWRNQYRRLPEAFAQEFAGALENLGEALTGLGRPEDAANAFREGLLVVLPKAEQLPSVNRESVLSLFGGYRKVIDKLDPLLESRVSALYGDESPRS